MADENEPSLTGPWHNLVADLKANAAYIAEHAKPYSKRVDCTAPPTPAASYDYDPEANNFFGLNEAGK